ncbi:DUF1385 domain-containing protein [Sinanaerobacter sp. ZZT-01]|uniref:DUF1385 domain-containing protein n=1 Tax=Sinanaerobacter sp. ZZT-01 TaxID=3111540 RepID=UPI002D777E5B|nr:DUF1385 domain-containing protein [Sinanaerobacter sp. ZZT-01]WRR94903.1 DUF1385 domain-containing protein [Sinanaerobacter sp. ZZT-01]
MDFSKIFIKNASPTKVGGQAILEGIMMRGKDRIATVLRKPDGGMHMKVDPLKKPSKWRKIPIVRGVAAFVDSLVTGTSILLYSAEMLEQFDTETVYEKDKMTLWLEKRFGEKGAFSAMLYFSVVLAILFTVGVFIILPTALTSVAESVTENEIALNLIEGVVRILMFVLYIAVISKMEDIKKVFQYHGAEHKTIHCYENKLNLTPENAQQFETLHPRCGTSFLMFVMVISLLLFSLLGWQNLWMRIGSRLLLIPVVAGLSYELLQWAGRSDSWVVKVLSVPGLLLQMLTTKRPSNEQLEVAIAAMKEVLKEEDARAYIAECGPDGIFKEITKAEEETAGDEEKPDDRDAGRSED